MASSSRVSTAGFAVGKGPGNYPLARTFQDDGTPQAPFANPTLVHPTGFRGGVYTAMGDLNFDNRPEIITGAQAGGSPHVRIFNGFSGQEICGFFAFAGGFSGGVRVATGNINGDGRADIIAGAGPGGGPHVRVFDGAALLSSCTLSEIYGFFAFPTGFSGGVFVGSADVGGTGEDDIIVGAGEGGGPHVRVIDGANGNELLSFFPFQSGFAGGVRVSGADINGDLADDIIVGAGPGGGPHVRVMDATNPNNSLLDIFPYQGGFQGGVFVAGYDAGCDGEGEILTGAGPGGGPHVRGFDKDGNPLISLFPFEGEFTGGVKVGGDWAFCN